MTSTGAMPKSSSPGNTIARQPCPWIRNSSSVLLPEELDVRRGQLFQLSGLFTGSDDHQPFAVACKNLDGEIEALVPDEPPRADIIIAAPIGDGKLLYRDRRINNRQFTAIKLSNSVGDKVEFATNGLRGPQLKRPRPSMPKRWQA